jgi:hypothetical protein
MQQLFDKNALNSWTIFETRNHTICLNIRFENEPKSVMHRVSYRKQSARQASRNRDRAQKYNNATHSTPIDTTANKKRKFENSPLEIPRTDVSYITRNAHFDTPETVREDTISNTNSISQCITQATSSCDLEEVYHDTTEQPIMEYENVPAEHACGLDTIYAPPAAITQVKEEYQLPDEPTTPYQCNPHVHEEVTQHPCSITPLASSPQATHPNKETVIIRHLKCPCCNMSMTPTHTCSIETADNLNETLSTPTVSLVPSPPTSPARSEIPFIANPKPPDRHPLILRFRLPTSSDKCQHVQPCMFCDEKL